VVAFDSERKKTVIVPSALGELAVHVRQNEQGVIGVSTSILALAALGPVSLDEFTCHTLYRCGHRLLPRTIFNEIRSIQQGHLLEVGGGRCEERRYWSPSFAESTGGTLSTAANEIADLLTEYSTSLVEPGMPVVSDLTGGYDSRVTTASLLRAGIPFVSTVTGSSDNPDVIVARNICHVEGLPQLVVDTAENPGSILPDIKAAVMLSEGNIATVGFVNTLRAKRRIMSNFTQHPIFTVSGALGEIYRDSYWAQEFFDCGKRQPASIDKLIRYRIDAFSPGRMDFFAHDWHRDWRAQLHNHIKEVIQPYSGERNTSQLDAFFLHEMSGMYGGYTSAMARWSAPLVPFFSTAALDRALTVPPQWRYGARLLRHICWSLNPRFAGYMTMRGCPCSQVTFRNWYRFLPIVPMNVKRLVRKASTVWLGKTLFPEYVEPQPSSNTYVDLVQQEVKPGGHLDFESMETASWYAPEALTALLKDASTPTGYGHRRALSWIYTCEAMSRIARAHTSIGIAADLRKQATA